MLASTPHNPVTGTVYSGGNRETLQLEQMRQGYSCSRWYTYINAKDILRRPVRRGETATPIQNPLGCCFSVFNEDQLVPASLARVDLETDDCVEGSIAQQDDRSHRRQLQRIQQELGLIRQQMQLLLVQRQLRLIRQYLEQC